MFRCSECQKEYDIKPDYCDDCGNDVFEEIIKEKKTQKQEPQIEEKIIEKDKTENKYANVEKKPDYLSLWFFIVCIIISFLILIAGWNYKSENQQQTKTVDNEVKNNVNIPNINSFWNNEPPKVEIKQETIQKPIEVKAQPVEVQKPQKVVPINTPPKTTAVVNNKAKNTSQPKIQTQTKTQTQPKTQVQPKTNTQPKIQQNQVQKPAQTVQQTVQQPAPKPVQTQTVQQPAQTVTQKDTASIQKELNNYKISLRNTIGRKIDFANVIGDGTCTVSFKIDSAGKLTNRAFSQQSSNTTLNDAVYKAIMSTPSFNPPPSGYRGETLSLKITFYGGNFQISLN